MTRIGALRIGVTGATGFIGQHLIRQALEQGFVVRAMVRTPAKLGGLGHDNLEIHAGGLGLDDAGFCADCDVIIHLAGLIKARSRADFDAVNVNAAQRVAQAAQSAGVARFILVSSMTARAPHLSAYAASKTGGRDGGKGGVFGRSRHYSRASRIWPRGRSDRAVYRTYRQRLATDNGRARLARA